MDMYNVLVGSTQNIVIENKVKKNKVVYRFLKRLFDIIISLILLVILSPIFALIAVAIKKEDGGTVIHNRICEGKNHTRYSMYKFRTMYEDSDNLEKYMTTDQIVQYKKECKLEEDPRITKVGKFLRRTSLDELPQIVNILLGWMSFVGPRPIVDWEREFWGDNMDTLLQAKPGLTGYWQVNGRSNVTYQSGERQRLELYYVEHQSLLLDLKILLKTLHVVINGEGAH